MYFTIEIQKNNGIGSTLVNTYETRNEAESKFHQILQYAALSQVEKHGAMVITEDCIQLLSHCYDHTEEEEE